MSRRIVIVSTFLVVFSILAIWLAGCSTKTTIDEEYSFHLIISYKRLD